MSAKQYQLSPDRLLVAKVRRKLVIAPYSKHNQIQIINSARTPNTITIVALSITIKRIVQTVVEVVAVVEEVVVAVVVAEAELQVKHQVADRHFFVDDVRHRLVYGKQHLTQQQQQ